MDRRISGASGSSYHPAYYSPGPFPRSSAGSSSSSASTSPEGLSPRSSPVRGSSAPRSAQVRLPTLSARQLKAEQQRLVQRVLSQGANFRSTEEERAQFKAAFMKRRIGDCVRSPEDDWDTNVWDLQLLKDRTPDLRHMKDEDMVALRAWTITPDYQIVQDVLEDGHMPSVEGLAYAKCLLSGLHSLPDSYTHRGTVFTGEDQSDAWVSARHAEGETVTNLRFFATSKTKEAAWQGKRVEWQTESLRGKHISQFSVIPEEQEVLFPPGTRFQIQQIERSSRLPHITIHQREV